MNDQILPKPSRLRAAGWRRVALAVALSAAVSQAWAAPVAGQRSFASPQAAVDALFDAVVSGDRRELRPLFGADTPRIAPIPDDATMAAVRDAFVRSWSGGHAIEPQGEGRARLTLGEGAWPYPLPVVRGADGRWSWDTRAGLREMDARRIGRNEIAAMAALHLYVDAQNTYARVDRNDDGVAEYARRLGSTPGKRDGLYWATAPGEPPSPLGLQAVETAEEVTRGTPFRGYRFRALTAQGPAARGGAMDYLSGGRLLRGFAAIATPASYGRSGLRTFVINHDGRVFSRDFGPHTGTLAAQVTRFDPGAGWRRED
ncbi:MAG: DUF2950 domain-containing protein [Burkholderiales bacterium]|jgi:hypothetical protein